MGLQHTALPCYNGIKTAPFSSDLLGGEEKKRQGRRSFIEVNTVMKLLEYCKKADVLDDEGELLCTGQVEQGYWSDILITLPSSFDYEQQPYYRIMFYDPTMGLATCRCTLSSPLKKTGLPWIVYRCEITGDITQIQRRNDIKIPLSTPTRVNVRRLANGAPHENPQGGYPATIKNISAGGVYLLANLQVDAGSLLTFHFRIPGSDIPLTAEILRAEEQPPQDPPLWGYGCRFVALSSRHESQLRSYVFKVERQMYKR